MTKPRRGKSLSRVFEFRHSSFRFRHFHSWRWRSKSWNIAAHVKFFAWLYSSGSDIAASYLRKIRNQKEKIMLHLIWYIFVGFLVGCVAKALMHTHLSITWTVVLGIVGSIIGGAVTHLFYPPSAGGKFHLGGLIVSIIGAILVLYIWHKFRLQLPRG
jgi:uncharacterized membrane protein YeaQ/YmgE (transglycosylase-associated protein family)